jgi:hypothetical protein
MLVLKTEEGERVEGAPATSAGQRRPWRVAEEERGQIGPHLSTNRGDSSRPGKPRVRRSRGCGESKGGGVARAEQRCQWHGGCHGELRCGRQEQAGGVWNGEDGEGSGSGQLLGGVARPLKVLCLVLVISDNA